MTSASRTNISSDGVGLSSSWAVSFASAFCCDATSSAAESCSVSALIRPGRCFMLCPQPRAHAAPSKPNRRDLLDQLSLRFLKIGQPPRCIIVTQKANQAIGNTIMLIPLPTL